MALAPEEIKFYRENGYVLSKGVFTRAEAEAFRAEAHALMRRLIESRSEGAIRSGWESAKKITDIATELQHCHNVQFHSAVFSRLILDPRLTDRAADLIGPNVQLHHTKSFIKPPERGALFPLHQDHPYFPHEKHSMIAAIIHFDDAPIARGCVRIIPGSHKQGPLEHLAEGGYHLPPEQFPLERATPVPAEAGDILFLSYLTVHGSGLNLSSEARTTMLVQMRDPTDHPTVIRHLSRGQGMMLRGVDPEADAEVGVPSESRYLKSVAPHES